MYKVLYTDIEKSVVREKKIDPLGRCSLRIGNHGPCFSTDGDVHGECTSISWDIGVPGSQKKTIRSHAAAHHDVRPVHNLSAQGM